MSDWFTIYLSGCAVAVLLWLLDLVIFSAVDWIAKGGEIWRLQLNFQIFCNRLSTTTRSLTLISH